MTFRGLIQRPRQVAAFLAGRRTQVRVPMGGETPSCANHGTACPDIEFVRCQWVKEDAWTDGWTGYRKCPMGRPGDVLAIREAHYITASNLVIYRADYPANAIDRGLENIPAEGDVRWLSPAVMPLRLARLRYRVLDIRAHLVREISEADAIAEGMLSNPYYLSDGSKDEAMSIPARANFAATWEADHGPGSWERDWCFAATVERMDDGRDSE